MNQHSSRIFWNSGLNEEPSYLSASHSRTRNNRAMGTRNLDKEPTNRRHHESHRRPYGAEKSRKNSLGDRGMEEFVDSLEGMNIGVRKHFTRVSLEDHKGKAQPVHSSRGDKDGQDKKSPLKDRRHDGHRHGEHRHKGHAPGCEHAHEDRKHKEHPPKDYQQKKHPDGDHCPKEQQHLEDRHKQDRHKEHHKGHHTAEKEFNNKMYESALLPFRENSGSPYKCRQSEIDFHHRGIFERPNNGPFVSRMQATEEVMRWNDEKRAPPREELEMIRQLAVTVHDAEKNTLFHPDIVVKAFADLDRVFFGGRLRGNVTVQWVKEIVRDGDGKNIYGETSRFRNGQCRIILNATKILLQRWRKVGNNSVASMFGTLLHEMCHAYDFVRCLSQKGVDAHDKCWQTMIGVIHDRCCRILGTWAIESGEPYKQHYFLSKEEEKRRKEALDSGIGGGKKYVGSERKGVRTSGAHKGTDCVVM